MMDPNKGKTELLQLLQKTRAAILPFMECPATNNCGSKAQDKKPMNATDLFSIFTADIIKEEVVFMR